ncbi:MAG TPA: alcohol dehydrogenase catalytic domain-containing protein, partial [Planctomycetota bacterium]|nr:alcohol dehydrogenase catalytic domain-containing protein [Planctomycetota bacterium]
MKAIGVFPGARQVRIVDHPEPAITSPDEVRLRILEVGVCGTDREICEFQFGEAPAGSDYLVLGHEALAEVVEVGASVTRVKRGDLVVPMVRLPCARTSCSACRVGRQDFCLTDEFLEHGIRRAHGFMTAQVVERERYVVPLPKRLEDVGVLIEPLTIAQKALLQVQDVQRRLPWEHAAPMGRGQNAVVLGAGPVGLLGAMALILRGYRTSVLARSPEDAPQAVLAKALGAQYLSTRGLGYDEVAKKIGPIDLVYEAAGAVQSSFDLLAHLGTNGIFVFTGVPGLHAPMA